MLAAPSHSGRRDTIIAPAKRARPEASLVDPVMSPVACGMIALHLPWSQLLILASPGMRSRVAVLLISVQASSLSVAPVELARMTEICLLVIAVMQMSIVSVH